MTEKKINREKSIKIDIDKPLGRLIWKSRQNYQYWKWER